MDAISLCSQGFKNVVAPLGTAMTEKQLNLGQNQRKLVLNLLNIFSGQKRAKEWRMLLNEQSKAERISLEQISNKALEIHMTNSL